ncbi:MAG: GDP-mannose 4,6-dehydratase [Phycisphaerales bacterium]
MKFLVTGGAGFIGSHAIDALLARGDEAVVLDDLSTGRLANLAHLERHDRLEIVVDDVCHPSVVEPLIARCDAVIHLAAAVGVRLVMEKPVRTIVTNVRGTEVVLDAASHHRRPTFVASTSEVYGKLMDHDEIDCLVEDGDWRLGPTSRRRWAYACSKALDEFLALAHFDERGLPVVIGRFFNTVGPRQTGRYGMVLPKFARAATLGEPIVVHGDGLQTRCFTHVADSVRAMLGLIDAAIERRPAVLGGVFNIGSTHEISMVDLAKRVVAAAGSGSPIEFVPYESVYGEGFEDMRRRTPDLARIRAAIGWSPQRDLDGILADALDDQRGRLARGD